MCAYSNCRNEFLVIINGYVEFNPTVRGLRLSSMYLDLKTVVSLHLISKYELQKTVYYVKCTTIDHSASTGSRKQKVWLAGASLFTLHTLQMWFGKPCEVWPAVPSSGLLFVPISSIFSRVVYCKCSMKFGQFFGTDYVVVYTLHHFNLD